MADHVWEATAGDLSAYADYADGQFEVVVRLGDRELREKFTATHPPIFGIDIDDGYECSRVAEKLAVKLETKAGEQE